MPLDTISESFEEEDLEHEFANNIFKIDENEEDLTNKIIELNETPFETRNQQEVYHNIYQITKTQLIQTGSLIDIPKEYIEEKYDTFLFEDPLKLQFMDYSVDPPYTFWKKAFCYNESWEMFAGLALRYSCSLTSESIVERYLSIQKCIQGNKMTNISTPVVKARMQLHQSFK